MPDRLRQLHAGERAAEALKSHLKGALARQLLAREAAEELARRRRIAQARAMLEARVAARQARAAEAARQARAIAHRLRRVVDPHAGGDPENLLK